MNIYLKIKRYFKIRARAIRIKRFRDSIAPYLRKDFGVELNYKLWTTKGARFVASRRNKIQNELSSQTLEYLSVYLIIIGLLSAFKIKIPGLPFEEHLAFITTAISIVILSFSHFETSKEYAVKSEKFHQCSLEIGELYSSLRMVKTFTTIINKEPEIAKISKKYDKVLLKYINHDPIDFEMFMTTKPRYFKISWLDVALIKIRNYFIVRFKYHLFMYVPPIVIIIIFLCNVL